MEFLKLKEIEGIDIDSVERTKIHRDIIQKKKFLKLLYIEWYENLKKLLNYKENRKYVELGSGGGFMKKVIPNIITSDVLKLPNCDMSFYGENMPFEDNSIDGILMVDVLHHMNEPDLFF